MFPPRPRVVGPLSAVLLFLLSGVFAWADSPKMNVIMILADDLGWSDTTLYGTTNLYETPNIERLAKRGMTFTRAYAASPLCSPTRSSILTGQNPARSGFTAPVGHLPKVILKATAPTEGNPSQHAVATDSVTRLDSKLPTLGKVLREGGYRTAHFGKWHLGPEPFSPLEHGFEVDIPHWAGPGPAGSFVAPWKYENLDPKTPREHIEDRMADEAVAWIEEVEEDPFYLQYWQFSVHAPFDAKVELIDKYRGKVDLESAQKSPTYAAMVESLDDSVGALIDAVDADGLTDRTVFVFFSDNGGNRYNGISERAADGSDYVTDPTSNAPLRGGKATVFEGGIRVPAIIVWPGVVEPGSRSDVPIQSTDLYPTILKMAGLSEPEGFPVDGVDLTPALKGEEFDRGPLLTYFPHSPGVPDWLPASAAVMDWPWKLIRLFHDGAGGEDRFLLFNLEDDPGEQKDLSAADAGSSRGAEGDACRTPGGDRSGSAGEELEV